MSVIQNKPDELRPLSTAERTALRQFCAVVDEIHKCRFACTTGKQELRITIDKDPSRNEIPQFDRDDFRSFMTLFRKLVANREPTQLFRVMKIIKRFVPDNKQQTFKSIKAGLNQEANNPPLLMSVGPCDDEAPLTPKRICDIYFNGVIFHSDPSLSDDVEKVLAFEPLTLCCFLRYAFLLVNVATKYAAIIRHNNFYQAA